MAPLKLDINSELTQVSEKFHYLSFVIFRGEKVNINAELIQVSEDEYHLKCDYFGSELVQRLSIFCRYDVLKECWIVPAQKIGLVKQLITTVKTGSPFEPINKVLDNIPFTDFFSSLPRPLYDHQKSAIPKIVSNDGFLLADDMGLGKSVTTLAAVQYCIDNLHYKKILIFSQKRAVKQWIGYSKSFTPKLTLTHVDGLPGKRKKIWNSNDNIFITNLEKIIPDFEHILKIDWDMVVLDEASYYIKNPDAKRSKKVFRIRSKKRIALTGTPIENCIVDLYAIFKFINPGIFGEYFDFERRYIINVTKKLPIFRYGRKMFLNIKKIVGYRNIDELKQKISPYYVRRTEKDIDVKLPQIVKQDFIIPLLPEQRKVYDSLKNKILTNADGQKINTEFNKVRLLRVCDHALFAGDVGVDSSSKIEELLSLITENIHRKMIVFSMWADMICEIDKLLTHENIPHSTVVGSGSKEKFGRIINDEDEFAKFKNDNNILIATDAVSRSQDFPFASVIINVDLPWNPATIQQRIMRARRLSSTHDTIFVFNLVSEDTIEEKVLPILEQKIQLARDIIDENQYVNTDLDLSKLLQEGGNNGKKNDGQS